MQNYFHFQNLVPMEHTAESWQTEELKIIENEL